jgi:hypothetical protein
MKLIILFWLALKNQAENDSNKVIGYIRIIIFEDEKNTDG